MAMQKYGNSRSEKNVKPERDKYGVLKKQNMQVEKHRPVTVLTSDTTIRPFVFLTRLA